MKKYIHASCLALSALVFSACGSHQVVYDDPAAIRPMSTDFSLADLNAIADKMVDSMISSPATREITAAGRPIVMVDRVRNDSDQHIDMESITDTIRTQLIQSGVFRFTDKVSRDDQRDEINWQTQSGAVAAEKAVQKGRQAGAQYIVTGRIVSYEERTKKALRKSYKFTMNLIDLDSGIIEWAAEKPITKISSKGTFGL